MNIIADNPVLKRELRRRLRVRAAGRRWVIVGIIIAAIAVWYYVMAMINVRHVEPMDAADWWSFTIYGLMFVVCLIGPAISATSISQERERQTWEALALTRLTAPQVLFGKSLAHLAAVSFLPAVMLPMALVCADSGGIGLGVTIAVYLYLLLNSAFFAVIGMVCSFSVPRSPWATSLALVMSAMICLGTIVIDGIIDMFRGGPTDNSTFAVNINPFYVLSNLVDLLRGNSPWHNAHESDIHAIVISVVFELVVLAVSARWMARQYGKAALR
jgi:ABC-2 type transport system permease protein